MTTELTPQHHTSNSDNRNLPWLFILFIGSGCAALIYEIVWFQMLALVVGSSSISLGIILAVFMGGMCLGSLLLPRWISTHRHPLRVYALLELGIGLSAVILLKAIPTFGQWYAGILGHGFSGILLRGVICALLLLPPTFLMGATLPAIARWVESTRKGVAWLGFFYCGNIIGAVLGCLLAGFYLLRVFDMALATWVAVSINLLVASLGFALSKMTRYKTPAEEAPQPGKQLQSRTITIAIALSGLTALGAEVIWTRLLSLILGATVYTFSIILAVFLMGLGIGSSVGSFLSRKVSNPRAAFGICQFLLIPAIAWAAWVMTQSLPYWPLSPDLTTNPWINFQIDLLRCLWAMLPAACLWGASFPLALAAAAIPGQDPGRLVGKLYAANTAGAIIGAMGCSLALIPEIGVQHAQQWLMALAGVSALTALAPTLHIRRLAVPALTVSLAALLIWQVPSVPSALVGYGRKLMMLSYGANFLYVGEGINAPVAVSELENGTRNFHVSGKVVASSEPQDMRLQRMLGHIPALIHPGPRSVLIVGFGAGVTAGSFVVHPDIERIVICEIEPLIPRTADEYFEYENYDVFNDPRVTVIYDDARHYLLTTDDTFDIITADPIHPWVKGAATLYTEEYFQLMAERLNPGGVITQWVPLYESNFEAVQSEMATFFKVFPEGTIWSNDDNGVGYDIILLGQPDVAHIDVDALACRFSAPDFAPVIHSLSETGFTTPMGLLSTYCGRGPDIAPWLADADINRDANLRLQYLGGMGLNAVMEDLIHYEMLNYYTYPADLFSASDSLQQALRAVLDRR
jgi:spermidine synthase